MTPLPRAVAAEAIGSLILFATVVGSGIMAEQLAGGNVAVALLGNTLATAAILFVLITIFGPVSGAQFNPAVSLVVTLRGEQSAGRFGLFVVTQLVAGVLGVWLAHLMFEEPLIQLSTKARTGVGQWMGEFVATFGLVLTILGTHHHRPHWVPVTVAAYIAAGYWFTSSTSFANPAIAVARSLSDSFAGIAPHDVPMFILAQIGGALAAAVVGRLVFERDR